MNNGIPLISVSAESVPEALYKLLDNVLRKGYHIRTAYDRKDTRTGEYIDPPGMDVSSAILIRNPYAQPRYPRMSFMTIGAYIAETCWGVKDHRVLNQEELKEKLTRGEFDERQDSYWPYTYHQRLFAYPISKGRTVNQVEKMLERLSKDPFSRRVTAVTFVPQIDQYIQGDLPCLQRIALRCTEDKTGILYLHMNTHWRSRDGYKGAPDNIIAMTFWQREWAEQLSQMMNREVRVGLYKDFVDSFHIYGEDFEKYNVVKQIKKLRNAVFWNKIIKAITFNRYTFKGIGMTSEDARDTRIIPDLETLLDEDSQWHFPQQAKDKLKKEIERMKKKEYLP